MLIELRSLSLPNQDRVVALRDAYGRIIQDTIDACQQQGVLDRAADAHLLSLLLLNMLNWSIFWYRPDGAHTPQQIADSSVKTFIDGWRAEQGRT